MISKELLSKVLKVDLSNKNNILNPIPLGRESGSESIFYWLPGEDSFHNGSSINIYELANLCKEWAFNMDRELMSYKRNNSEWVCFIDYDSEDINKAYLSDTEPDAIFKACEYILKGRSSRVS